MLWFIWQYWFGGRFGRRIHFGMSEFLGRGFKAAIYSSWTKGGTDRRVCYMRNEGNGGNFLLNLPDC